MVRHALRYHNNVDMKAIRFETRIPETAPHRFLLMSCLVLVFAVLGHLAFAQHWPKVWRVFEVAAILSAPLFLCIGVLGLWRQFAWQMIAGVVLSAIGCALVCITVLRLIHGLNWE